MDGDSGESGPIQSVEEVPEQFRAMFSGFEATMKHLTSFSEKWWDVIILTNNIGSTGSLNTDILIEHSIFHLLSHRRQLEKFIQQIHNSDQNEWSRG